MEDLASDKKVTEGYSDSKTSKFKFKSKDRSKRDHSKDPERDARKSRSSKRHRIHEDEERRHRHRDSKRRRKHGSSCHDPTFDRNGEYQEPGHRHRESLYDGLGQDEIDSDAVFRESLFDAMADEEGAEYWEGVYGYPVHTYPNTKTGSDGKLERMTDEEYVDYVRTKMWEKSHEHILEERAARAQARQRKKEEQRGPKEDMAKEAAERDEVMRQMEESLKRGEQRKRAKAAEAAWARYLSRWEHLKDASTKSELVQDAGQTIPWPVASGKARDVEKDEIERFLRVSGAWQEDPTALLKVERVRWHPDKMQQRFGWHMDADSMKLVTAVFQVVDRLWNDRSSRRS